MNHCPVYQKVGGHAYGWVYPGPMGSVLTPSYVGIDKALDLPQAATLCGECNSVCPVGIPLSDLLRKLRCRRVAENHVHPRLLLECLSDLRECVSQIGSGRYGKSGMIRFLAS